MTLRGPRQDHIAKRVQWNGYHRIVSGFTSQVFCKTAVLQAHHHGSLLAAVPFSGKSDVPIRIRGSHARFGPF